MHDEILQRLVMLFNKRDFAGASVEAAEGLLLAQGRDEVFWIGLGAACDGYRCLMAQEPERAEQFFVTAMHNLRNFGFSYQGFQITGLLAGLRRCAEEIRHVRGGGKRMFDITLLPQLKMAEQEQQMV